MSSLTTKTNRATVVPINFGVVTVEGLVFPDGSRGITFAQFMRLLTEGVSNQPQLPSSQENFNRDLKRSLGKDSPVVKEYAENHSQSQNVLTNRQISEGLIWATGQGSKRAKDILMAVSEGGLDVLFDDALDLEVSTRSRAEQIQARAAGKPKRRSATEAMKDLLTRLGKYGDKGSWVYFARMTDALYMISLGADTKGLQAKMGIGPKANLRDHLSAEDLQKVAYAEETYARALDATGSPEQAEAMVALLSPSKP